MFIVFGTTSIKSKLEDGHPLPNMCPNCKSTLIKKRYRRWFTLFFIPIFPFDTIDTFYECEKCSSAYSQNIKYAMQKNEAEQQKAINEAKKIYATSIVATMTHMALIDGDFAIEERRFIEDVMNQFDEFKEEIAEVYSFVKTNGNDDNYVFNLLNAAKDLLSSEGLIGMLAQSAQVLLADGKIEKEEEDLMKEYIISCGLPKDFYQILLDKLKEPQAIS